MILMTLFIFLCGLCFVTCISIRGALLLLKNFPIHAAIGLQGKPDLCIKGRGTVRENQWLNLHLPACQVFLCQQRIAFFCGLYIKDDQPTRLADEMIMKDGQRKTPITDKVIENLVSLCC